MSIVVNIYYTGTDRNEIEFAEETESSGIADAVCAEDGNISYEYFFRKTIRKPCC